MARTAAVLTAGNSLANAATLPTGLMVTISAACLIEQEAAELWKVIRTYEFLGKSSCQGLAIRAL